VVKHRSAEAISLYEVRGNFSVIHSIGNLDCRKTQVWKTELGF